MKRLACLLSVVFALLALGSVEVNAQQSAYAELGLNKDVFYPGDYMNIALNVGNNGADVVIDAYLSLETPSGTQLYAPDFSPLAHPWVTQFHLPGGWESGWFYYTYYKMPSLLLPTYEPGDYTLTLWLSATGTSDQVTAQSSCEFKFVPCQLEGWINDNWIQSIDVRDDWVWIGLADGVGRLAKDNSYRYDYLIQSGLRTSETLLFEAFDGKLGAAGKLSVGIVIREPYGWRNMLDNPLTPGYVHHVLAAQLDEANSLWIVHDGGTPQAGGSTRRLIRVWADGSVDDYTSVVEDAQHLCLTGDGDLCVVGSNALHIFDGSSLDSKPFDDVPGGVYAACGDPNGNVWLSGLLCLVKCDLKAGLSTTYCANDVQVGELNVTGIACDADSNVWFCQQHALRLHPSLGQV